MTFCMSQPCTMNSLRWAAIECRRGCFMYDEKNFFSHYIIVFLNIFSPPLKTKAWRTGDGRYVIIIIIGSVIL